MQARTPQEILKTVFGYDQFKPLQKEVIAHVLEKKDTLAVMPTGGGKSLCYEIPALIFPGLTIVVSPLIALMHDQVVQLTNAGIEALVLNSALGRKDYYENMEKIRSGAVKLLYLAPESLVTDRIQELLATVKIDCITIDEAHCISEWGHDFRPEYRKISEIRSFFPEAVCLALTATATSQVRKDIRKNLKLKGSAEFVSSFNRENIYLEVMRKNKPVAQALEFLSTRENESGIIYCFSRKQVDSLTEELQARKISALPYHAGLRDEVRIENQNKFIRDDVRIMVATVAFGMGINKPNVSFVIHFDLPKSLEQYYQEIGRAGRDGKPSHALLLYSYGDTRKIRFFLEEKSSSQSSTAEDHLKAMTDYADSRTCRRVRLLSWFGETYTKTTVAAQNENNLPCCDICNGVAPPQTNMTIPTQKILSCIIRTNQRYGASYLIDILLGSRQKRIIENKHNNLSVWGIGTELAKEDWFELVNVLIQEGYLTKDEEFSVLFLTSLAKEALTERFEILLPFCPSAAAPAKLKFEKKSASKIPFDTSDAEGARIFLDLKNLRRQMAEAAAVPPYVIFSDRTLEDIATKKPVIKEQLKGLYGIGEVKAERYGEFILQAVRKAVKK
ncbi:MAG TPA: DNA helicase RecQ [Treponemataceae bacterium]|nr:DNA helicase RecQ [Treponemataceae bacterium]